MSLSQLAPEWQDWLLINLERQCSHDQLLVALTKQGGFPGDVSERALEDGRQRIARHKSGAGRDVSAVPRPDPDVSANTINADDRAVKVLMSVDHPRILLLQDVLGEDECDGLIAATEARMRRSTVVDDESGATALNDRRSSSGAFFHRGEGELVARIERRLAQIARWPVDHGEGLQILRYAPGGEYRPHYDWFDPSLPGPSQHLSTGGQRVGTFVLYLSDVESGGGTTFPDLGLEVRPKKGSAVFFANVDGRGRPDRKTLHGGQMVVEGVKYIATKWLRERRYGV